MRVLLVASDSYITHQEHWAKFGIQSSSVPHGRISEILNDPIARRPFLADAVVFICDYQRRDRVKATDAVVLAARLRQLGESVAMIDGRKWNAVPILVLVAGWLDYFDGHSMAKRLDSEGQGHVDVYDISTAGEFGTTHIQAAIHDYRSQLLAELDDLGFIVTYENGRYRVGPAFRRRAELAGRFYFGAADRRGDHFVTVHRDLLGVQLEVE